VVSPDPAEQRGQLILIGALLVAATILGSVTLLNAIHESPDINTQQDSKSIAGTERTLTQVQDGLERAFLVNESMNETGEALPYADGDDFEELVEEYSLQYGNLTTTETAAVLNVTLDESESLTGGIARQNRSSAGYLPYQSEVVIRDAAAIPRLSLLVNETSSSGFTVELTGDTSAVQMDIDDTGISGDVNCDLSGDDGRITIDFVDGHGEISTPDSYCGPLEFGPSLTPPFTVEIRNLGGVNRGTYTVTGVDPNPTNPSDLSGNPGEDNRWYDDGGPTPHIVNPVFAVEYRTPNIEYDSTVALYNETGR